MTDTEIDKLFTITDQAGNKIKCHKRNLILKLASERRERNIGKIVFKDGELIYSKPEKEEDIYRKLNAWSVPYSIITRVDRITFYTKKDFYRIRTKDIEERMIFLHFKNSGIEKKKYIPLDMWEKERRV